MSDKEKVLKYFTELVEFLEYHNSMSPFPVYDSEFVEVTKQKLEEMKQRENYDDLPVTACKYCNSLSLVVDEQENDVCTKCGAINEVNIFDNIFKYLETKDGQ